MKLLIMEGKSVITQVTFGYAILDSILGSGICNMESTHVEECKNTRKIRFYSVGFHSIPYDSIQKMT